MSDRQSKAIPKSLNHGLVPPKSSFKRKHVLHTTTLIYGLPTVSKSSHMTCPSSYHTAFGRAVQIIKGNSNVESWAQLLPLLLTRSVPLGWLLNPLNSSYLRVMRIT